MRFGAVYFTPTLALKDLGVDSNVFNTANGPQKDFTFTLSPQVDGWLPVQRRALLSLSTGTDFIYFKNFSSERSVSPRISGSVELRSRRVALLASAGVSTTRERPSFEIDARSRRREDSETVGLVFPLTPKTSLTVGARRGGLAFDQDATFFGTNLSAALSRHTTGYQASVQTQLTPKTKFEFAAETRKDRFIAAFVKNADTLKIVPALIFNARALVSGSLRIGFERFQTLNELTPDYKGVFASTDLAYTLLGSTRFGFRWNHDVQYSFSEAQPFFLANEVGVSVRRQLAGRIDSITSISRIRYSYRIRGVASGPDRHDVTKNISVDVGYNPNRTTRAGISASYLNRSSDTAIGRGFTGWRIGVGATYGR